MDQDGRDKVSAFIKNKWKHGKCPVCASNAWQIAGDLADLSVSEMHANDISSMGAVYPLLPVFCTVCGYTLLFNSNIAFSDVPHAAAPQRPGGEGKANPPEQPE